MNPKHQKGYFHPLLIIILLVGLVIGVYLIQQKTNLLSFAFEPGVDQLTNQLISLNSSNARGSQDYSKIERMISVAQQRQALLEKELEKDPNAFLQKAKLTSQRSSFPSEVQKYLEEEKTLEGEYEVLIGETFQEQESDPPSESKFFYAIKPEDGEKVDLYFTQNIPDGKTGDQITASGTYINKKIVVGSGPRIVPDNSLLNPPSNYKVAVVMLKFANDTSQAFTKEQVQDRLFGEEQDSANLIIKENSYNKVSLSGDIYGWYTLPPKDKNNRCYGDTINPWLDSAKKMLAAEGVNITDYNSLVYIFNDSNCWFAGLGSVGGSPGEIILPTLTSSHVIAHELGHNFGLGHSNSLRCNSLQIDQYKNCYHDEKNKTTQTGREYGDVYTLMGGNNYHLNAPHKIYLGWINNQNILNVRSDGIYKINSPVEVSNGIPQAIKISKPDTNEHYYLEYRQGLGLDRFIPFTQGSTLIHIGTLVADKPTQLLDVTPDGDSTSVAYPGLKEGLFFHDPINKILVRQIAHDPNSATLEIKFNIDSSPSPFPTTTPTPAPSLKHLMRVVQYNTGVTEGYRCPINQTLDLGVSMDPRFCTHVSRSQSTNLQYTSEWIGKYQGKSYLMRLIYYKDGRYQEQRCSLAPEAPLGALFNPTGESECTAIRDLSIGTGLVYTSEWIGKYQGTEYLMRITYEKDGTLGEYRCPLDDGFPLGAKMEPSRDCTMHRKLNIGNGLKFTSEWIGKYQGTDYLMRLTFEKDGRYGQYRCPLDESAGLGARMEPGRDCTQVLRVSQGDTEFTSEWITDYRSSGSVQGVSKDNTGIFENLWRNLTDKIQIFQ